MDEWGDCDVCSIIIFTILILGYPMFVHLNHSHQSHIPNNPPHLKASPPPIPHPDTLHPLKQPPSTLQPVQHRIPTLPSSQPSCRKKISYPSYPSYSLSPALSLLDLLSLFSLLFQRPILPLRSVFRRSSQARRRGGLEGLLPRRRVLILLEILGIGLGG